MTYHVLLIGIDDYRRKPLDGCVNDIDAVQRLLLGPKVALGEASIRRLASPRPGTAHETRIPSERATLANIRAELARLAGEAVTPGDRVLLYYAGHGVSDRVEVGAHAFHREALAPEDCHGGHLMYDHELNEHLAAIARRTRSVTMILDACHSAGITRDPGSGMIARCLEPHDLPLDRAHRARAAAPDGPRGLGRGVDDVHVVSACLDHERAYEDYDRKRVKGGLLTQALVDVLDGLEGVDLRTVPWAAVWEPIRERVLAANALQHVWMAGNAGRAVLAGPPVVGDPGLPVRRVDAAVYRVGAGTLAGVTEGAELAIYGEQPAFFPPLGSAADRAARLPVRLEIRHAGPTSAEAVSASPIDLPAVARARIVRAGRGAPLRYALESPDAALADALARSPLLEPVEPRAAQVLLQRRDHRWLVADDVHGADTVPLVAFSVGENDVARRVLEHYTRYALPLQLAARTGDLAGALALTVCAAPSGAVSPIEAQEGRLLEASRGNGAYEVTAGARVAFRVANRSRRPLRVTLVNCAASGRVQLLGDHTIGAASFHMFWLGHTLGRPFVMSPPPGSTRCIDRLLAIGRTDVAHDLSFLRVDTRFSEIIARTRGTRDADDDDVTCEAPPGLWAVAQALIRTS